MKKGIAIIAIMITALVVCKCLLVEAYSAEDISVPMVEIAIIEEDESSDEIEFNPTYTTDLNELQELLSEYDFIQFYAHMMAESARALGYEDTHEIIQLAKQANLYLDYYEEIYEIALAEQSTINMDEYPVAAEVWIYLTDTLGYSEEVTAGIIGNMMAEVGGQTLALQPSLGSRSYYGICQWSLYYYPEANGMNLQEQLDFLSKTIKSEFNTFGGVYKYGFDYNSFLKLTDVEECAMAFAKSYERCGSGSYGVRKSNALIAYEYFTA